MREHIGIDVKKMKESYSDYLKETYDENYHTIKIIYIKFPSGRETTISKKLSREEFNDLVDHIGKFGWFNSN